MPEKDPNDMLPHDTPQGKNTSPSGQTPQPVNMRAPQGNVQRPTQQQSEPRAPKKRGSLGILIVGIIFALVFIFVLVLATMSATGNNTVLQSIFGIQGDIKGILRMIVNVIFGLLDAIALISIVVGGFIYMVAMGDKKEIGKARKILIISGISFVLVSIFWAIMAVMLNVPTTPVDNLDEEKVIITQPEPAQGSAPLNVIFDVSGFPKEGYFFNWDFGDSLVGTGKTLSHTYTKEGFFEVKLQVINGSNQETTMLEKTVLVENTKPIAVIVADPISGRAPLEVTFDASDSKDPNGSIVKYSWDYGDTTAPGDQNAGEGVKVSHVYSRDGVYTATLTVEDNNGEVTTISQSIDVGAEPDIPTAAITTTPDYEMVEGKPRISGIYPLKISFSGAKSKDKDGEIVKYDWDFGDGSPTETSQTATHSFDEVGTYIVQLTVTDNDSKKDSTSLMVIVQEPEKAPTAVISSTPPADTNGKITGFAPLKIDFDGSKSSDPDGNIVLYEWNLGDNSPIQTGELVTYQYEAPGEFTVTLTVKDNDSLTSAPVKYTILVKAPLSKPPVGSFKTDPEPATGYVPFTVDFDASASYDPDGNIMSYEWDFGDGNATLSGALVSHEYYDPGIFKVTLTVYDNDNLTGKITHQIAVLLPAPVAKITASRTSGTAPLTISFDASESTGSIVKYDWDFDDGQQASGRKIDHQFTTAGTYDVLLKVSDSGQQVSKATVTITVN